MSQIHKLKMILESLEIRGFYFVNTSDVLPLSSLFPNFNQTL